MSFFKRFFLFFLTNMMVLVTISIVFSIISSVLHLDASQGYLTYLLLFSLVWGMGGALVSLLMSKAMAKMFMGVQVIDPQTSNLQHQRLVQLVHSLARRAHLPGMPEVGIYDSPEVNAFATGPSKSRALVAVSSGLLYRMSEDEVEGVLGHEIAHVANGDMVTMTLIQGVVNAFVLFFSRLIAGVVVDQLDEKIRGIAHFALVMLFDIAFTLLGSLVVFYFSRRREFRADFGGANYAGRAKMIGALRRLQGTIDTIEPDPGAGGSLATLKISDRPTSVLSLFRTHPSLEERIERLQKTSLA